MKVKRGWSWPLWPRWKRRPESAAYSKPGRGNYLVRVAYVLTKFDSLLHSQSYDFNKNNQEVQVKNMCSQEQ